MLKESVSQGALGREKSEGEIEKEEWMFVYLPPGLHPGPISSSGEGIQKHQSADRDPKRPSQ